MTTSTTEQSRQILQTMYAAAISGDMVTFNAMVDDDAQFHEPGCLPYGGSYRGKKTLIDLFMRVGNYLDFSTIKIDYVLADGANVITAIQIKATNGNDVRVLEEALVRDGKVVDLRVFLSDPALVATLKSAR